MFSSEYLNAIIEKSLDFAKKSFDRYKTLFNQGAVSREQFEEKETSLNVLNSKTREMKTALVAIADLHKVWINSDVDETDIGRITTGDSAEVTSDAYPGRVFKGEVVKLADYIGTRKIKPNNAAKNTDMKVMQVKVKIKEANPFKPGMTVDVKIKPGLL